MKGRWLALSLTFTAVPACALVLGIEDGTPRGDAGPVEAGPDVSQDVANDAADGAPPPCDPNKPFGAPMPVTELNSSADDGYARLSADELTVVFESTRTDPSYDLYVATRASVSAPFGSIRALSELNGPSVDRNPWLRGDGLALFYMSNRSGGVGGLDVWRTSRLTVADVFGAPALMPAVNTNNDELAPYFSATELFLASNRGGGTGGYDLWGAKLDDAGTPGPLVELIPLNSTTFDVTPVVSEDGTAVYFASQRGATDASATYHVYLATRSAPSAAWGTPSIVTELNDPKGDDYPAWISRDSCRIYLTSTRGGNRDVYMASRPP